MNILFDMQLIFLNLNLEFKIGVTVLVFARFSRTRLQCISALLILIVLIANANNCNDDMLIGWAMRSSSATRTGRVRRTRRTTRSKRLRRSRPPEQQQQVRPCCRSACSRCTSTRAGRCASSSNRSAPNASVRRSSFSTCATSRRSTSSASGNCSAPAAACGDRATVTTSSVHSKFALHAFCSRTPHSYIQHKYFQFNLLCYMY